MTTEQTHLSPSHALTASGNTAVPTELAASDATGGLTDTALAARVFDAGAWGHLAGLLANQDLVLVPDHLLDAGARDATTLTGPERSTRKRAGLALLQHWASLSFVVSQPDAVALCALPMTALTWLHATVTPALRERLGAHVPHAPMYAGFPREVMNASDAELLFNALLHYHGDLVDVRILPLQTKKARASTPKADRKSRALTLVRGGELRAHLERFTRMATAWTPFQAELMALAEPLLEAYGLMGARTVGGAPVWPNRENQAVAAAAWLRRVGMGAAVPTTATGAAQTLSATETLPRLATDDAAATGTALVGAAGTAVRAPGTPAGVPAWPFGAPTTTDVLRTVVVLSGGSAALARDGRPSTHPKSTRVQLTRINRAQRRALLGALETASVGASALEDLHRYRPQWRVLAERLHVGEWADRFPQAAQTIDLLRNHEAPATWDGRLEQILNKVPTDAALARVERLLPERAGAAVRAARRLLAWTAVGPENTREAWGARMRTALERTAAMADTGVVLAAWSAARADAQGGGSARERLMIPKGRIDKRYRAALPEERAPAAWSADWAARLQGVLCARLAALGPMGTVHVEPGLDGVLLPQGLRDASETGAGVVARGSRLPVVTAAGPQDSTDPVVRLFLWWHDTAQGRVDVDLSAVGVTDTFATSETCNFQALRGAGLVHSGDLTSAPNGAAEFVDVHLNKLNPRTRYVVLAANVYAGPTFDQIPECFVGWMERSKDQHGSIHDVRTVANKIRVTARTKGFVGAVFDVTNRTLMWLDVPFEMSGGTSIHGATHGGQHVAAQAVEDFSLYAHGRTTVQDLIDLHVAARGGVVVSDPAQAHTRFTLAPTVAQPGQTVIAAVRPDQVMTLAPSLRGAPAAPEAVHPEALAQDSLEDGAIDRPLAADPVVPRGRGRRP